MKIPASFALKVLCLATSCALLNPASAQTADTKPATTGVQALRSFVAQHPALSGDFVQTVEGKSGQQTGSFALAKPGMFRWALKKPFEQLIVSDGKVMTQWDADLNQATQRSAAGLFANTPLALLMGGAEIERFFTVSDAGEADELSWVLAVPKNTESQFKTIKLGFKQGLPQRLTVLDAFGGTSHVQFKNISTTPVPASSFQFVAPKGADVVKM